MDLGDPKAGGDVGLRETLVIAQAYHFAQPLGQALQRFFQRVPDFQAGELGIFFPQAAGQRAVFLIALGIQRDRAIGMAQFERLHHFLERHPGGVHNLRNRRGAADLLGQRFDRFHQRVVELAQTARDADGPELVAEVPLDLTDDRGGGVGGKLGPARGVETVNGLQQTDAGNLDQILHRFPAVAELAGQIGRKVRVREDERIA